jgi:hypothetical protein
MSVISLLRDCRVRVMAFNATFNNISIILWRSVLLVKETGVPRETHV